MRSLRQQREFPVPFLPIPEDRIPVYLCRNWLPFISAAIGARVTAVMTWSQQVKLAAGFLDPAQAFVSWMQPHENLSQQKIPAPWKPLWEPSPVCLLIQES